MPSDTTPKDEAITAARELLAYLDRYSGHTADWPVRITVDNARDRTRLSKLLNTLKMKLEMLP